MGLLTLTALFREEHRRRKKSCPFFSASAPALTNRTGSQSQSTKPPSKSKPPSRSTSKSKHQDILQPTKTHDGDLDNDSDSSRPIRVRSRSKSVTRSEPEESNAEGEVKKKTLRSKSKTKAEDSENAPRKSSRSKAKASKGHEVPPKPSRTRSKTKVFESEPEEEVLTIKPRSTSRPEPRPLSSPSPARQKMNVVEISSDEESRQVIELGKVNSVSQSGKESTHGSTMAQVTSQAEPQPEMRIVFSQSRKSKRSLTVEVVQPNNALPSVSTVSPIREIDDIEPEQPEPETNNHVYPAPSTSQRSLPQTPPKVISALSKLLVQPNNPLPSTISPIREIDVVRDIEPEPEMNNHVYPTPSTPQTPPKVIPALSRLVVQPNDPLPSVPAVLPIREIDVVGDIAPEPEPETNNHVDTAPSTPQRSLPPPTKVIISPPKAVPSTTVELIPALSKLPSIPLHTLTEAELDMTVEEWIRYQMDVEYDKFRRDGERELQRFRNQAEEVRKAIEGL